MPAAVVLKFTPRSSVCVPEQIKSVSGPWLPKVTVGVIVMVAEADLDTVTDGLTLRVGVTVVETVAEAVAEELTDELGLTLGLSLIVGVGVGLVATG